MLPKTMGLVEMAKFSSKLFEEFIVLLSITALSSVVTLEATGLGFLAIPKLTDRSMESFRAFATFLSLFKDNERSVNDFGNSKIQ